MAIVVKKIELWNVVVGNEPGALAGVLEPLADAGADLDIVMGTAIPGADHKASIGISPVKGKKVLAAARAVGLAPAGSMPSLLISGENRAGLGGQMSEALAAAGIDIGVAVAQVVGPNFSALFGFANQDDATKAAALIKKLGAAAVRSSAKKAVRTAGKSASAARTTKTTAAKPGGKAAPSRRRPR